MIGKPARFPGTTRREYARRWTFDLGENQLDPPDAVYLEVVFGSSGKVRRVELSPGV